MFVSHCNLRQVVICLLPFSKDQFAAKSLNVKEEFPAQQIPKYYISHINWNLLLRLLTFGMIQMITSSTMRMTVLCWYEVSHIANLSMLNGCSSNRVWEGSCDCVLDLCVGICVLVFVCCVEHLFCCKKWFYFGIISVVSKMVTVAWYLTILLHLFFDYRLLRSSWWNSTWNHCSRCPCALLASSRCQ